MAQVDTSIYANSRPFTMSDPIEQTAKAYQLKNMALAGQQAERKMAEDDDIKSAAAEAAGDPQKLVTGLYTKGRISEATALQKNLTEQEKARLERTLKLNEAAASDAIALDQVWRKALQDANGDTNLAMQAVTPIYGEIRTKWAGLQHQLPEQFDPVKNFAAIGQAKEVVSYLNNIKNKYGTPQKGIDPATGKPALIAFDEQGNPKSTGIAPAPEGTELTRLQAARDALPADDPRRKEIDQAIQTEIKKGRGTSITNVNGPMMPGKNAQNKVDEGLLDTTSGLMKLDQISGQFKPEYQQLLTRGSQWFTAAKEKLGADLNNKEKKDLTEFSAYKRNSINALNEYIKSITGAAMTNAEAERILKGLPNPGSGLFDGDSPTEFKAKLDDAIAKSKMAVARLSYIKRKGMSLEDGQGNAVVSLDQMPALMNQRGQEIEKELKAKGGTDGKALGRAVRRQLSIEFGLSAD